MTPGELYQRVRHIANSDYLHPGPWGAFQASLVERMHIHPHLRQYSVGLHSGRMAILALELFDVEGDEMLDLLTRCLQHDLHEAVTGDLPAPLKWASDEIADALAGLEDEVNRQFGWGTTPRYEQNHARLKALDLLELGMTCLHEEEMGNQHLTPVREKVVELLAGRHGESEDCPFKKCSAVMAARLDQ